MKKFALTLGALLVVLSAMGAAPARPQTPKAGQKVEKFTLGKNKNDPRKMYEEYVAEVLGE